ncbi:hypothetical protein B0T26DRAFT_38525 [Lasiosphaeria miniovina]|uniref:Uncharacterized protein n=1 Tax=Lasiosphaeria miniovina TaxID=1954250 RepID=A0AA40BGI8_9PEZI|nr:uncharacterized protein B0T26DRAFT_38525 [Lasiosphaeria miniovina]KAK0733830.1 hypothetical protein B0T26DRAFT_38525 [Lasiosphaeria miniovina]
MCNRTHPGGMEKRAAQQKRAGSCFQDPTETSCTLYDKVFYARFSPAAWNEQKERKTGSFLTFFLFFFSYWGQMFGFFLSSERENSGSSSSQWGQHTTCARTLINALSSWTQQHAQQHQRVYQQKKLGETNIGRILIQGDLLFSYKTGGSHQDSLPFLWLFSNIRFLLFWEMVMVSAFAQWKTNPLSPFYDPALFCSLLFLFGYLFLFFFISFLLFLFSSLGSCAFLGDCHFISSLLSLPYPPSFALQLRLSSLCS